ncbi:hypothetical protein NGB36_14010 [Streptomyces sp. RB6PN25]|uniref:Lipoprotein n=1 Tax=Streptomyces humicola TaxID=2953240 RepID=A0ABT1PVJ3_9ACTN|nr:hypothetical protein [Streptomyces humicola]MCQ4081692.1 hypothetical protein [Streptomyces humicola]
MNDVNDSRRSLEIDTRLIAAGAVLTGVGATLAFAGMTLVGFALVTAGRRWVRQMEVPPSQLAAAKLQQAKQASQAGIQAWQSAGAGSNGAGSAS